MINAALLDQLAEKWCDEVWVVLAPKSVRATRLMKEKKISHAMALARIRAQKNDAYYRKMADVIITNHGSKKGLTRAVRTLLASYS